MVVLSEKEKNDIKIYFFSIYDKKNRGSIKIDNEENIFLHDALLNSFYYLGIKIKWKGSGVNEYGVNEKSNKKIVVIDKKYFRPNEVDLLVGDSSKALKELNWKSKTSIDKLIKIMIDSNLKALKQ